MATVRDSLPTSVQRIRPADYQLSTIQDNLANAVDAILGHLLRGSPSMLLGPLWLDTTAPSGAWTSVGLGPSNRGYVHTSTTAYRLHGGNYFVYSVSAPLDLRVYEINSATTLWEYGGSQLATGTTGTLPELGDGYVLQASQPTRVGPRTPAAIRFAPVLSVNEAASYKYAIQVRQTSGSTANVVCAITLALAPA